MIRINDRLKTSIHEKSALIFLTLATPNEKTVWNIQEGDTGLGEGNFAIDISIFCIITILNTCRTNI